MKYLNIITQSVLAVAILILFILHFNCNKKCTKQCSNNNTEVSESIKNIKGNVAYVDIDTLVNNYNYYKDLKSKFEQKQKRLESEFENKKQLLNKKGQDLQYKMSKHLILQSEAEQQYAQLQQEGLELQQHGQELTMQLGEEEQVLLNQLMEEITQFLKNNNKNNSVQLILGSKFGGTVLYGNDSLNITKAITSGLNEEYAKKQSTKSK